MWGWNLFLLMAALTYLSICVAHQCTGMRGSLVGRGLRTSKGCIDFPKAVVTALPIFRRFLRDSSFFLIAKMQNANEFSSIRCAQCGWEWGWRNKCLDCPVHL